jgi:hypothetical protein
MSKMFQWVIAIVLLALVAVNVWLVCTIRCHGAMCNGQKAMGSNTMVKKDSLFMPQGNLTGMYINSWTSNAAIIQGHPFGFTNGLGGSGTLPVPTGPDTSMWICAMDFNVAPFAGMFIKAYDSVYVSSSNLSYPPNTTFIYWIQ